MPKQRFGCIYRLTNTVTGKKYIGKSIEFKQRMSHHRSDALNMKLKRRKSYLQNSIRKHGWENFKQEILIDDVPEEDLNNLEISYIAIENTMVPRGYNMTIGGEGGSGYKHTPENLEKSRRILAYYRKIRTYNVKPRIKFSHKKWYVEISKAGKVKTLGFYRTKEKAQQACKMYERSGKVPTSERDRRKPGTGSVTYLHPTGWRAKVKKETIGYYETELEAHDACNIYLKTGKKLMSWTQRRILKREGWKSLRKKNVWSHERKPKKKGLRKKNVWSHERILKKKDGLFYNYVPKPNPNSKVPLKWDHECYYCNWRGTCTDVEKHIKTCWKRLRNMA